KFRATFGYNGNLDRSTSAYTTASYQPSAVETRLPFAQIVNPPNPELRWEKIATLNLGLDFKFFKGKLSGSFDYFTKKGSDIIGESPFAPSSGITTFYGNVANTKTTGIDLIVNGNLSSGSFSWQGTFIYNYSREIVTRYSQKAGANNYVLTQGVPREGYPLYSIYYYDFAGLDSQTGDALGYLNGVLSKDYTRILASYNATNLPYAGSSRPVHFGSLRNTFSYGKLSLSAIIAYRAGYYVKRPVINYGEILTGKSGHAEYTMRWKSPGDELITNVPSLPAALNSNRDSFYQHSSVAILKGDHIRLQDIRLDYRFSGYAVLKKLGITDASVYLYGQNLGLLWKANQYGLDPDYISSQPLRSVAFGLQLTL
ncbi:MAG: TonB-dependent receptor, partial [Pedobacter sp.]